MKLFLALFFSGAGIANAAVTTISGKVAPYNGNFISEVTLSANATTYQFTGLNSVEDRGYIVDFAVKNGTTTSVSYNMLVGTFTTATDYESERFINSGAAGAFADDSNNAFAISAGSLQPVTGRLEITHVGSEINYESFARDGTIGARRSLRYEGNLEPPLSVAFTSFKLESSAANGLGSGTILRLYKKR